MIYIGRYSFMCLTKERRDEIDHVAMSFCNDRDINCKDDIFVQLKKLGFEVISTTFKKSLSGMILVDEHEDKLGEFTTNKIIAYNSELNSNLYMLRFVLAHELAHYISQKADANNEKVVIAVRDRSNREEYHKDIYEQEMDYMAASLLVPREDFIREMNKRCDELLVKYPNATKPNFSDLINDLYFIQKMQTVYRVDDTLIKRRIKELGEAIV